MPGLKNPRKLRPSLLKFHPALRPWKPRSIQHNNGYWSLNQLRPVGSRSWPRSRLLSNVSAKTMPKSQKPGVKLVGMRACCRERGTSSL